MTVSYLQRASVETWDVDKSKKSEFTVLIIALYVMDHMTTTHYGPDVGCGPDLMYYLAKIHAVMWLEKEDLGPIARTPFTTTI